MDSYLGTKREDGDRGGHIDLDPSGKKIIASALSLPHTSFQLRGRRINYLGT